MSNTRAETTCGQPDPDTLRECEAAPRSPGTAPEDSTETCPAPEGQDYTEQSVQPGQKTFLDHVRDSMRDNAELGRLLAE